MARHRQARWIATLVAGVAVGGALSTADAQTTQRGQARADTPRLIVVNFRAADKANGVAAANAVRDRLMREYSLRDLWVIDKKNIDNFLEQSGYPTDEALSTVDAQQLARLARADEFVEGSVTPQAGQYRVDGRVVLTLNPDFVQPLPSVTVGKPGDAGAALARAVKDARPSLEEARECYNLARQQKYAEAQAAAQKAIADYPTSTIARICQLGIMDAQKASNEQKLAVAEEILKIDPRSKPGLRTAYTAQEALGQTEAAQNTLLRLVAVDPGNATLVNAVVNSLAASRNFGMADSVITEALEDNPGESQLMRTAFLVYLGAERYKKAIGVGEELVQLDTAAADTTFFVRLASAYSSDSQPQKAAEVISRAMAKYPNNPGLLVSAADMYRQAGQLQQAQETLNRALASNPNLPRANLTLAQIYAEMNSPDSAVAALRRSAQAGDSIPLVAGYAATLGNRAYQTANQSKARADWENAVKYLALSDSLNPSNTPVKFVLGYSAFQVGYAAVQEGQQSPSCDLYRKAQAHFQITQRTIPQAGSVNPEAAGQIMSNPGQMMPYVEQQITRTCK
jgi:tetratricopeptide (TPR) repeat protein